MPAGLGENSPIKLSLTRENFNALIGRHSQPIRWLKAEKCPCVGENRRVDENCPLCNGNSYTYEEPTEFVRVENVTAPIDGVINLPNVIWIRDLTGLNYSFTDGECVTYAPDVKKGQTYTVKYIDDVELSGTAVATYVCEGLYSIDIPTQVAFGEVQGSLLTVSASVGGEAVGVETIYRNMFQLTVPVAATVQVDVEYTYLDPFAFVLIHNNFDRSSQKYLDDCGGDGLAIFPQRFEVHSGDILVALNASETKKHIFRSTGLQDNMPSFYLYEIQAAHSIRDDERHEYEPGTDFIVFKGSSIKWIGSNRPEPNEQVSITYTYKTVYTVAGDIPDPRTSENNRFPRKVAIKLYTDFNRRMGI